MNQFNVHQAKTHLSAILDRVEAGEEIVRSRAGRPIARIVPLRTQASPRVLGQFAGQTFAVRGDFDDVPDDIARAFGGDAP